MNSDDGMHKLKPVGNGAKGAAALTRDLSDCETLAAIEAEDSEKAGRIWHPGGIEPVENLKREKAGREKIAD
jgi:hypothetical protein